MLRVLTISLAVSAAGCGQGFRAVGYVEPELRRYVEAFETEYGVLVQYSVVFEGLPGGLVGQCRRWKDGRRKVVIDREFYESAGHWAMHQLVFHELGHCSLGLGHNEGLNGDGYPVSTMYPYAFGGRYYGAHLSYYNDSLRDGRARDAAVQRIGCVKFMNEYD